MKQNDLRTSLQSKTQRKESSFNVYTARKAKEVVGNRPLCPNRRWQPDRGAVRPPALLVEGSFVEDGGTQTLCRPGGRRGPPGGARHLKATQPSVVAGRGPQSGRNASPLKRAKEQLREGWSTGPKRTGLKQTKPRERGSTALSRCVPPSGVLTPRFPFRSRSGPGVFGPIVPPQVNDLS